MGQKTLYRRAHVDLEPWAPAVKWWRPVIECWAGENDTKMFRWHKRRPGAPKSAQAPPDDLRCSFCNKPKGAVRKLIAGPTVFICDECVQVCVDIIADERLSAPEQTGLEPLNVSITGGTL